MDNYIFINNNSLSKELCDEIIELFEFEDNKKNTYGGVTSGGLNINTKDTQDFQIIHNKEWTQIRKCLETELIFNLEKYTKQVNNGYTNYKVLPTESFFKVFQMQRYIKNKGKFIYHSDDQIDFSDRSTRILTYLWYLNDVDEGGETEICVDKKIKPTQGKLLIFPASWLYPHSGLMPISNNKYIITGWINVYK
jgi:hypothetical protein